MPRIIECVPNFSEGRNKEVIEAIASAIAQTPGCSLLDVDPGASTNRTVYTFVGSPDTIVEGALNSARAAYQLIDMRGHHGEHPRMGSMDVCPFIPVQDVTMEDCVNCAKEFGERLALELGVSVYLYGEASTTEGRKTLPQVREGEYEGLPDKMKNPFWKPDFGLQEFNPSWGATAVGARKFLIAYNINMLSTKEQAHRIALNIRENGRGGDQPGRFKNCQAIGWYLEEANMAQVSINLTDFTVTGLHDVYESCLKDAEEMNIAMVGSQVVGLVPLQSLMETAEYYMEKESLFILEEDQKLRLVINRLGLNSLGAFAPKDRIIEYMTQSDADGALASMDLKDFILTLGSRSPSPGGGSVAALASSVGAALGSMVGFLSYGNKKFAHLDTQMRKLIPPLYKAMKDLVPYIDADALAFTEIMVATKLPKGTEEEKEMRELALKSSTIHAVEVPLKVATIANSLWPHIKELASIGNINCKSDLQVGAHILETGVYGAYYNVLTNLETMEDSDFSKKARSDIEEALKTAIKGKAEVLETVEKRKE